jgi:hypothetical protein
VFGSGIVPQQNCSIFFPVVRLLKNSALRYKCDQHGGLVLLFMTVLSDGHGQLPHVTIAEDGRLCSMGQHRPGFPQVLYDALLHLGYNRDVPIYRAHMSMVHSMGQCEVSVMIPIRPEEPWLVTIMGVELDDTIDKMAHFALASLCGSHLVDTATTPLALFPFHYRGDPM